MKLNNQLDFIFDKRLEDAAIECCIQIYEGTRESTARESSILIENAWDLGRKLKLGFK
jgi:hypothetical protein